MPSIERPEPPYVQIANQIREQIKAGVLKDGDQVPSARQITRDWNVAMATAAKVIALLRSEGVVRTVPGVGTVVQANGTLHLSARDRAISIHRTGKIYPPGHYAKIRSAELAGVHDRAAGALGIDEGDLAVRRQRTTYDADNVPVSTSVSWYPAELADLAPLLLETERIQQGTSAYVAEQTGKVVTGTHVQHAAGYATSDDAQELQIAENSPVLLSRNRFVDDDGIVVEYGESVAKPDHWVFYEYTIEDDE